LVAEGRIAYGEPHASLGIRVRLSPTLIRCERPRGGFLKFQESSLRKVDL
jgi:hypothetical protein